MTDSDLQSLAGLLIDCVDGGASVSFMAPLTLAKALDFWRGVAEGCGAGSRIKSGTGSACNDRSSERSGFVIPDLIRDPCA